MKTITVATDCIRALENWEYSVKENEHDYKILGIVPYNDLMDLMHLSIAVINPSKSEGWSSTVEQAISYNKHLLLSNIGVHKEQNPRYCNYFSPKNYEKLSKLIYEINCLNKQIAKIGVKLPILSIDPFRNFSARQKVLRKGSIVAKRVDAMLKGSIAGIQNLHIRNRL